MFSFKERNFQLQIGLLNNVGNKMFDGQDLLGKDTQETANVQELIQYLPHESHTWCKRRWSGMFVTNSKQ